MALTGTYTRSLDEKHRLAVPKRLREQFDEEKLKSLFVAPGTEDSLVLYSPKSFTRIAEQLAERMSNRAEVRNYKRLFYARAEEVPLDGQARIRIPDRLVTLARLSRDVVLLGVHDHVEIWERELWQKFLEQHSSDFDDMSTQAFE